MKGFFHLKVLKGLLSLLVAYKQNCLPILRLIKLLLMLFHIVNHLKLLKCSIVDQNYKVLNKTLPPLLNLIYCCFRGQCFAESVLPGSRCDSCYLELFYCNLPIKSFLVSVIGEKRCTGDYNLSSTVLTGATTCF